LVENSVEKAAREVISVNQQLQARAVSATTYAATENPRSSAAVVRGYVNWACPAVGHNNF
jgi:hypothetical protein